MTTNENKSAVGAKVAPAVGLLLFGEQALAQSGGGGVDAEDVVAVPEPSTLALFAIGAAAAGVARALSKKRDK